MVLILFLCVYIYMGIRMKDNLKNYWKKITRLLIKTPYCHKKKCIFYFHSLWPTYGQNSVRRVYYTHRVNRVNYAAFILTKLPLICMQNSCIFSAKCRTNVVSLHTNHQIIRDEILAALRSIGFLPPVSMERDFISSAQ